jgi:hypothetical protein
MIALMTSAVGMGAKRRYELVHAIYTVSLLLRD